MNTEKVVGTSGKGRIEYIDIAKAMAIFLVLIGHTVDSDTIWKNVLYSFHMPLFFLLSGMVINREKNYKTEFEWVSSLQKKFFKLLLPYLIWGCIYAEFSFKNLLFIIYGTRETLIAAGSLTSLWFIPVYFLASVMIEGILNFSMNVWKNIQLLTVIVSICFVIVGYMLPHWEKYGDIWGIDIAFMASAFMIFGYLIRPIVDVLVRIKFLYTGIFFSILLIMFCIGIQYSKTSVGYVLMANAIYGNLVIFLLNSLMGSLIVILLAVIICRLHFDKKYLNYIGQNTLGIFIVHKPFIELGRTIMMKAGMNYNHILMALLNSIVCLAIICIVVNAISVFIPTILGKGKDKENVLEEKKCKILNCLIALFGMGGI
ncbi:MAG: acyltransferase family protein [Clostridium sp.]|nr:acyltransferase family protein [Clostridium sp.]